MIPRVVYLMPEPTDDKLITCIACGEESCEYELHLHVDTKYGSRKRLAVGLHENCAMYATPNQHVPVSK